MKHSPLKRFAENSQVFPKIVTRIFLPLVGFLFFPLPEEAAAAEVAVPIQERRVWQFEEAGVSFSNEFPGARLNAVEQTGEDAFTILIQPENRPINNSAWYAFDVTSKERKSISITLTYEDGRHRYRPQISEDGGKGWSPLPSNLWQHDRDANQALLTLEIGPDPVRIAGQELIGNGELREWMSELVEKPFVQRKSAGESILGQPIEQLTIGNADSRNYLFIVGRQHPPELTGTLGLIHFVERLTGESELAEHFRARFQTVVFPLMNPDGVDHGHWRSNMAGVDINRDWGEFDQPETRAAGGVFQDLAAEPEATVYLLLDFHSTHRDVFYTQPDEMVTFPEGFTAKWLGAIQERMDDYRVNRNDSYLPTRPLFMNWGYQTFGAPSITFELGDRTDRDLIRRLAVIACDEMMRLLLEELEAGKADVVR